MLNKEFMERSTEKYRAFAESQTQKHVTAHLSAVSDSIVSLLLSAYQSGLVDGFNDAIKTYGYNKK